MTAAEWGKRLAAVRRAHGLTQESLAEQLGVSRQAVAKWERGAALPGPGNLLALRQCLGDALPEPPGPAGEGAAESAAVEMPPAAGDAAKAGAPAAGGNAGARFLPPVYHPPGAVPTRPAEILCAGRRGGVWQPRQGRGGQISGIRRDPLAFWRNIQYC